MALGKAFARFLVVAAGLKRLFSTENALADVINPYVLFINSPTNLSGKNSNRKARSYPSPVPVTR